MLGASYDALNRLVSQLPTGPLVFAGRVSEPARVTVQGAPAIVTSNNHFRSTAASPIVAEAAGHRWQSITNLSLTLYRAYDPNRADG